MSPISQTTAPGAMNVDMVCQDGTFSIENLSYYEDTKTGTELTAEADWNRRGLYIGPQVGILLVKYYNCSFEFAQFDTLDVGVQDAFDQFLNERGVNEHVAQFIPEYASYKEQQVSGPHLVSYLFSNFFSRNTSSGWAKLRTSLIFKHLPISQKYSICLHACTIACVLKHYRHNLFAYKVIYLVMPAVIYNPHS